MRHPNSSEVTMYTFDHTLALCDYILDTLACEHEPTLRWRRIPAPTFTLGVSP